jgi:hypothetical protein
MLAATNRVEHSTRKGGDRHHAQRPQRNGNGVPGEIKTYIVAVCRQFPDSWRRGSFVTGMVISIAAVALLLLGWRFDAVSIVVTACGISLVATFDVLIYFPFQLWKANMAKIKLLEDKIARRLEFVREIRQDGDSGHYFGNITVRNTSDAEKMQRCRCEIAELSHYGEVIGRNIGLIPKGKHHAYPVDTQAHHW